MFRFSSATKNFQTSSKKLDNSLDNSVTFEFKDCEHESNFQLWFIQQ